jgi:hypothetical protein
MSEILFHRPTRWILQDPTLLLEVAIVSLGRDKNGGKSEKYYSYVHTAKSYVMRFDPFLTDKKYSSLFGVDDPPNHHTMAMSRRLQGPILTI